MSAEDSTTQDNVRLVMREIRARREAGLIGVEEEVSIRRMAAISQEIGTPVSERTLGRIEHRALAKLKLHPLARLAFQEFLRRSTSPES